TVSRGITMVASLVLLSFFSLLLSAVDAIKPRLFEPRIFDKEATGFGPIFEEEPLDTVYAEDSPEPKISMNCRVRANPPATVKWWHNNWEIKLLEQPDEHYSLVGGNLVITHPDKNKHAGKYVCAAKNVYGTVVSKEAIVRFGCCELEEKERFWSELDEVMESIPTGERVVLGADFNGHVGEGNRGDEEVMCKFGVKERNLEGQMKKRSEIEKKTKWWKPKKEECCEEFRQKLRQALGGQVVLPDYWETTAEVIRETGRKVLGVSSGRRKEDKETWWWNEEVQDSIQRKRLAKKKWYMYRTEENSQEYKELQRRVKREVSKAKQKAYNELYTRLDTREGEKDLYRLARQRDRDGKDVQQVRVIKDRDGRVLTSEESVQRRWKEYFEELMNEENERGKKSRRGELCGTENLEKLYDRVPREELWYCMRKSGVAEKYVRVVQDMYERSRTVVRCAVGQTEEFKVEVGLHQGSALSPFLFAMMMDQLSEEVKQESPWTMMFADDIVICSESREQVEENPERWRFALERRGMKVSRIQSNGECGKEVKKRVQAETVSLRKRQESELEVAELKMLRFSLGVTRLDRIRNEYIRGTAHVGRLGDKVREARLRWFGHVQRRENLNQFPTDERETVSVKEGQGVVLLCDPPSRYPNEVMYRWIYNDFPNFIIPDQRRFVSQTTGNLYIAKVEASDIGNYSCFVSSPTIGKSVFSTPFALVPEIQKEVSRYPADIRVRFPKTYALVGQNVTLECFALGNPLPHIRWRKLDADLPPNYEVSMNGALLHLINVQYEDEGSYECEALNVKGMDWYRQWLYVEGAPEWAEHINDTEKDIGSELTLSCTAVGKPLPWIRWLKDGFSYGKGELKFSSLTFDDSGMYQCIAENNWGTIYANAELRVVSCAPTFIYNPVKKILLGAENGRVVIECKPRAAPKPRFIWKRGLETISNSSRVFIWNDGSLEILNVTKADEGLYTCYAENDHGRSNSSGTLFIKEATKITVGPLDVEVTVGENTILQCSASYDPSFDITFIWSMNSYIINFATDYEHYEQLMDHESSGHLLIKNIQVGHAGHYTCTAQTIVDNATASANVNVKGRPGPPGGVRVEEIRDTSVKLVWSLGSDHGSPLTQHIVQTRDFYSLDPEDWKTAVTSPMFLDGKAEAAKVIELYPWMEYEFRVYAINDLGEGECSVPSIKIKTWDAIPTMAPTDVNGYIGLNGELIVTWTPMKPQYFFGKKFGYIVGFKYHEDDKLMWSTVADPEARRYVYKDAIIPNSEIQIKVKGYNNKGEGPFSQIRVVYSSESAPTGAPLDVYARQVTSTEALVWWLPVYQVPPHWVDGYQIRYWRKYDDNEAAASRVLVHSSVNQTRLENMRPDSHYLIEVRAYNGAGLGPPSEHCEMFTRRPPPSRRLRVYKYVSFTRKWLYIYWDHIYNYWNESYVEGYKILFRKEGERYGKLYTTGRHYIDFPMPETGDYVIEIRARCEGGDGPISQIQVQGAAILNSQPLCAAALLLLVLVCMNLGL
ncbi:hypothetical protein QTP86_029244, partial [Hemibagrus guttatus]